MAQVRKIAGLALVSAAGLLVALWLTAGLWAMSLGPSWFSAQLKSRAGIDAAIGSLRTNFANSLSFRDVVLTSPAQGRIEEVRLSFQPWDLFSFRSRNRHVFLVTVTRPDLTLPENGLSTGSPGHGPLKIIPVGATVVDGTIRAQIDGRPWLFNRVNATIRATPFRIEGDAETDLDGIGALVGRLKVACTPPRNWEFRLTTDSVNVERLVASLPALAARVGEITGTSALEAVAKGTWGKKIALADWRVRAASTGINWRRQPGLRPIPLSGTIEATPRTLKLLPLKIGRASSLEGEIRTPWQSPDMDLRAKIVSQPVDELMEFWSQAATQVRGDLSATATLRGQPANPSVTATYDFSGSAGRFRLPPVSGQLSMASHQIDSTTTFAGGQLTVTGVGVAGLGPVWSVNARDVSLAELGETNGWSNVAGTVGARFLIRGTKPAITGRIDTSPVRWGRLQFAGTHGASVRFTRDELIVRADDGSISVTAFRNGPLVHLQTLNLALAGAGGVSARGDINLETREIDLDAEFNEVSADIWPPLVTRYPEISGSLSANGRVGGTIDDPSASFDLTWKQLRFRKAGDGYDGEGLLEIDRAKAAIRDATWANGYSGEAVWRRQEKTWDARLDLLEAAPGFIWDVVRATGDVSGLITGKIDASGGARLVTSSSFSWTSGQIGRFAFDQLGGGLNWNGDRIELQGASLVRGSQAVRGRSVLQKIGSSWTFEAVAQVQRWGVQPLVADGEIQTEGKFNPSARTFDATVTAPVFWLADRSLENLKATVKGTRERVRINGVSDARASFDLFMERNDGRLGGQFTATDLVLHDLFQPGKAPEPPGRLTPPTGRYDIEATLGGTLADPSARIRAVIRNGAWRRENFSAEAILEVNRSTVTIVSAKAALEAGGELYASGAVGLGKDAPIRIEGAGADVDLQAFFHLMWWPVRWNGRADTGFLLTRDDGPLAARIRFDGEHDGFGPFRDGGGLKGEIVGRDREWTLDGVYVESGDGHARLRDGSKLYLDKDRTATLRLVADMRNLYIGPLALFGATEAVGRWQGEPGRQGRRIEIDVFARSLWINQFVLDGNVTHMTIEGKKILFSPIPGSGQQLSGTLAYDHYPDLIMEDFSFLDGGREKLYLNGNVGTRLWDFSLRARGIDASVVRGLLDTSVRMSGPMDFDLIGRGTPRSPEISGSVRWTDGRIGVLPLDEAEGTFVYRQGDVRLDDVTVQKKRGYFMKGSARLGIGAAKDRVPLEINLLVDRGDLTMMQDMFADVNESRGSFEGRLRIGGSAGLTTISGFVNAQKVSVRSAYTPNLNRGELRARFEKDRLIIDRASARLGRGELVGGGHVDFTNGRPSRYDLFLRNDGRNGASIRVPQLAIAPGPVLGRFTLLKKKLAGVSRGEPVVDLKFTGSASSPTLAGTVLLDNTVFTYPPSRKGGDGGNWGNDFLSRINWDLALTAGRRTWYQNELVDAGVTGAVDIRGTRGDMEVRGKVRSEQGSIVYSGNEFRIKEAELEIDARRPLLASDRKQTVVYLKAIAEKEVFYTDGLNNSNDDVIVMVVDRAPIGEIQPRFYSKSNPNLSSQRALQLALGLPFGDAIERNSLLPDQRGRVSDQADTDKMLRLGLIQLLDSSLASPLARAIARNTGLVDFIRVSYQENDPHAQEGIPDFDDRAGPTDVTENEFLKYAKGTRVRFGRGLGRRLFADYSFRVDEYESELNLRHELELAYRLHRNLFLRGTSELDRERELGRPPDRRAILENQWRFGLPRRKATPTPTPTGVAAPTRPKAG